MFNDKDNPVMWFFTSAKGEVTRLDNVPYYTITDKFMENALEKELVAVLKKVKVFLYVSLRMDMAGPREMMSRSCRLVKSKPCLALF